MIQSKTLQSRCYGCGITIPVSVQRLILASSTLYGCIIYLGVSVILSADWKVFLGPKLQAGRKSSRFFCVLLIPDASGLCARFYEYEKRLISN